MHDISITENQTKSVTATNAPPRNRFHSEISRNSPPLEFDRRSHKTAHNTLTYTHTHTREIKHARVQPSRIHLATNNTRGFVQLGSRSVSSVNPAKEELRTHTEQHESNHPYSSSSSSAAALFAPTRHQRVIDDCARVRGTYSRSLTAHVHTEFRECANPCCSSVLVSFPCTMTNSQNRTMGGRNSER